MYAVSLLRSVRQIEVHASQILEMRMLSGFETELRLLQTQSTLIDLAELLRSSTPLPADQHKSHVESAVMNILKHQYKTFSPAQEELRTEVIDTARQGAEIEYGGSWLFVPLGEDGAQAKNWNPVIKILQQRLPEIVSDFNQISHRIQTDGGEKRLNRSCKNILEMLEVLEYTLGRITATNGYVSHRTDHNQDKLLKSIEREITVLRGDTDA